MRYGHEAVELADAVSPDAVVMDLLMPRMNGLEAIQTIRERHPGIGIVAYTAVAGNDAREQTAGMGVELVLKSGDPALVGAIQRSLSVMDGGDGVPS